MSSLTLSTEATLGAYPERLERPVGTLDRLAARAVAPMVRRRSARRRRCRRFPELVGRYGPALSRLSDDAIRDAARTLGWELRAGGYRDDAVARAFALVRETARRTLGECHFDVQLVRGRVLLERLAGDETRLGKVVLRGLNYAIVDEADSVLIDEARTPLIISGGGSPDERRVYATALALATRLTGGRDFLIDERDRAVRWTDAGELRLDELAEPLGGVWAGRRRREELVRQALTALHLFQRDRHYIVRDRKVHIIDEFTGRLMSDRSWEHGLHQLIEVKEDCPVTARHDALARISYQRFFR